MRAGHVIGIDFELRFCQKLAVIIEQQRLADLVAIGLLRPAFTKILPWNTPTAPLRKTFLNTWRLSQFTASWVMNTVSSW